MEQKSLESIIFKLNTSFYNTAYIINAKLFLFIMPFDYIFKIKFLQMKYYAVLNFSKLYNSKNTFYNLFNVWNNWGSLKPFKLLQEFDSQFNSLIIRFDAAYFDFD